MSWTAPRTWVTGELLNSGTLNTHIRDNERYLHGDDGPVTLNDRLNVPSLYVGGVQVDPGVVGGSTPPTTPGAIVNAISFNFGTIPVGPSSVRLLATSPYLVSGQRYFVIGKAALEVSDTNDAGQRAEFCLGYLVDSPSVETILDQAFETMPVWSPGPATRREITVSAYLTVGGDDFQPDLRIVARKNAATGSALGRGLKLTAYPI
jgi:hypothetical protein